MTNVSLQAANVTGFSDKDCCNMRYSSNWCTSNLIVHDQSVICAGSVNAGLGVCNGDSGGT
jgi:hypothetical protein